MITFTDKRLYVKGTCTVSLQDIATGNYWYVSDKAQSGNITLSVNLNEIRAGLGNPIAAMIPSDSAMQANFTMADFNLKVKAAQAGAVHTYSAPAPKCVTVTATTATLAVNVAEGTPVAGLGGIGLGTPKAYVQQVGASSMIDVDGAAYDIDPTTGVISGFTATANTTYKITYMVQNVSAELVSIGSLLDPKVAYFTSQHAVFCNESGIGNQGTRIGWLYVIIPCLKLQADATITGDQTTPDTTIVSGQAIAYDPSVVPAQCADCSSSNLGYYVYVPDDAATNIRGLAVVGGVTTLIRSTSMQLPVRFVMGNGSLVVPTDTTTGFTYTGFGLPSGTSINASGLITAGTTAGDGEITTTYTAGGSTFTCVSNISVTTS